MLIHDASGAVAVVSAESVRIVGEGCIKSIPDEVQMAITDEGEVRDGYGY